jgi:hypothetical protein
VKKAGGQVPDPDGGWHVFSLSIVVMVDFANPAALILLVPVHGCRISGFPELPNIQELLLKQGLSSFGSVPYLINPHGEKKP